MTLNRFAKTMSQHAQRRRNRIGIALVIAIATAALSACAPLVATAPVDPRPGWIGFITSIEGPNAFVDLGNVGAGRRARVGETLLPGDRFFTGDGTRMKVEFASGGYVELDENTDPRLLQDPRCLLIDLFASGRMFVDKNGACIESQSIASLQQSKVAYEVMDGGRFLQITVVEGEARTLRPEVARAPQGWRIDVNSRQVMAGGPYKVSDEEIRNTISWTRYYRELQRQLFSPMFGLPLPGNGFPPAQRRRAPEIVGPWPPPLVPPDPAQKRPR